MLSYRQFGSYEFSIAPLTREESTFRHSGWVIRRCQVWESLKRLNTRDATLAGFAHCGSDLWLCVNEAHDDLKLRCNQCHHRMCIPCATARAAVITENLAQILDQRPTRFLTLTLRHSDTPLTDQIHRLRHSFNMLRRRQSWKSAVKGGAAFLEIKLGEQDGLYHVHLHCLIEGSYWDQREISREWHCVTGDSSIVHVKAVTNTEMAARYVTKYVTKPADSTIYRDAEKLDEFITALKGQRLCMTFGSWRGLKLEEVPESGVKWISCGHIDSLLSNANRGDQVAMKLMGIASRKWPLLAETFGWNRSRPPPDRADDVA